MSALSVILMSQKRRRLGPSDSTGMVIEECALRSARCDRVILRNGDAVERVFGMSPVAARDPGPAQACVVARFDTVNTSGDPLVGIWHRPNSRSVGSIR